MTASISTTERSGGGPYKWLDLERFFRLARPHDEIQAIRYFTAYVNGPTRANQQTYLQALAALPLMEIILGRFKTKQVQCRVSGCTYTGRRLFPHEEEANGREHRRADAG